MKIISRMALVSLCGGLAALTAGVANARTPTPTATPTVAATATSTPSPQQVAFFEGTAWLNGRLATSPIVAKIGDIVCGEEVGVVTPTDSDVYLYGLRVLSDQYKEGCGREGAVITFSIDGQQAAQTAVWHAGSYEPLTIIAGPPFARFIGELCLQRDTTQFVEPFIGGQLCGHDMTLGSSHYETIVYSAEQQPGCGFEGAPITFKLVDAQGNVLAVASQTGFWHAWGKTSPREGFGGQEPAQQIDLFCSLGGITVGNTGTGDGPGDEGSAWGRLSILLGFVGVAGATLGLALRRRATTR